MLIPKGNKWSSFSKAIDMFSNDYTDGIREEY